MADLLTDIAERLKDDYAFKATGDGKFLRQGVCPGCSKKSLWTYAATPWVIHCERLNNCGYEAHAKELYNDLFESWTDRYQAPEQAKPMEQQNPNAAADAYLRLGRGFDLALIKGTYTQEHYFDPRADQGRGAGSSTVRFAVGDTWWERIIDKPQRFGKKKANFKFGASYAGQWWALPSLSFDSPDPDKPDAPAPPVDLWLVEGIFNAIALEHHGIAAVACMSCNNYPLAALEALKAQLDKQGGAVKPPRLVWALDGDTAGQAFTVKHVKTAREAGWVCTAAQIPQKGKTKIDWNDLHQRDKLADKDVEDYLYHGALLIAASEQEKALLMYQRTGRSSFDFVFKNRLWWFELNVVGFAKAKDDIAKDVASGSMTPAEADEKEQKALLQFMKVHSISNCYPLALYYQRNDLTDEAWYYFRVAFPDDRAPVKGTFTSGQLTSSSEFEKRLLHMAAGAMFSGSSAQLKRLMQHQLEAPRVVSTVDFVGYSASHKAYILGKVAVKDGQFYEINAEDYFDIGKLSIKTLQASVKLVINTEREQYDRKWVQQLWHAFGAKGYVALAFWFGSLFAEQIREAQASFPFMEIVGEPGSGKSTLIQFLWKLLGRDYEGFDPSKSTSAGRQRTFTQVSNLPIVLIESDRETKTGNVAHIKSFDWDELKDAYNGNSIRTTGVKTGGNETYDPPFRASIVISQNNQVQASQAIMERICHMTFDTRGFNAQTYEAARGLERLEIEQVSGFMLSALKREAEVMALLTEKQEGLTQLLLAQDGIHKTRIAKNHAQLLACAMAMRSVVRMTDEQFAAVQDQIITMARERQHSINADHPLVAEFWETFDYLDTLGIHTSSGFKDINPNLNHSTHVDQIWVNLNEYYEQAAMHRQQVPVMAELKKVLKTSKSRRFIDIKPVSSAIKTRGDGLGTPKTVYCWQFENPAGRKS